LQNKQLTAKSPSPYQSRYRAQSGATCMCASKNFRTKPDDVRTSALQERKFAIADSTFWADHDNDFTHSGKFRSYNFR
jgi:hypothetical protein